MHPAELQNTQAIPLRWVDEIFRRFTGRFGNPFLDKYRSGHLTDSAAGGDPVDTGIESAKSVWAEEMAGLTPDEIKRGLAAKFKYIPSSDDFIQVCRPEIGAGDEVLFHRAVEELCKRRNRQPQTWPFTGLYWATVRIGGDMLTMEYKSLSGRWKSAITSCRDCTDPVPDVAPDKALPAPTINHDRVREILAELKEKRIGRGGMLGPRELAHIIADEVERGVYKGGMWPIQQEAIYLAKIGELPDHMEKYLPRKLA